jgi:hypothetical protein
LISKTLFINEVTGKYKNHETGDTHLGGKFVLRVRVRGVSVLYLGTGI